MTDTPILRTLSAAVGAADPASDADLLRRYAHAADGTAFELLVRRHAGTVWAVCRAALPGDRHAAEDAFQATFLALARKAGRVRGESAGGWLFRVARNAATRARSRRTPRASEGVDENTPDLTVGARQEAERDETAAVVQDEVDRLAAKYRDPVVLCFYQGHSHAEAAARLGWPIGTVASRLARAKDRLRDRLTRRGVALSAVGLSAARVDAGLVRTTLTTVLGPAGRVPPGVLTLTNGVVSAMRLSSLKLMAAGSAAAVVLTVGVFAAHGPRGAAGGGPGGRSAGRSDPPGVVDHLHALHDHLYRLVFGARAEDADKKAVEEELKALEGEWRIVKLEDDGKEVPADAVAKTRLTFKGDEMEQREEGRDKVEKLKVALAPGAKPKHLDLTALTGPEQVVGKTARGIYKRDGDTLTICGRSFERADEPRPTEFKAAEGVSLVTLERVKADKPAARAGDADKAAVEKELKKLEGVWRVKSITLGDRDLPADTHATVRYAITGDTIEVTDEFSEEPTVLKLVVSPGVTPKGFDTTMTTVGKNKKVVNDGEAQALKDKTIPGVYKLDGDTLTVCARDVRKLDTGRPTELKAGEWVGLTVFERVKDPAEVAAAELKALDGRWRVVRQESDGKPWTPEVLAGFACTIAGGEMTHRFGGRTEAFALRPVPGDGPKRVDLRRLPGPDGRGAATWPGIYEVKDGRLTFCYRHFDAPAGDRPAAFESGKDVAVLVLERVKGEADELAALAGEWTFTGLSHSGKDAPADEVGKVGWSVTEAGELTMTDPRGVQKGALAVAPGEAPPHVTLTLTDGPEKGNVLDGVYFRHGDKLLIAFADPKKPGSARPKELKPGEGVVFITLERKK